MFIIKDNKVSGDIDKKNIGEYLVYEREKQGLSQAKIAQELRLSLDRVQMLEELSDEDSLRDIYVRGYLRSYYKLLGLESDLTFSSTSSKMPLYDELDTVTDERTHELIRIWGSAVIVSVIIALLALWWIEQNVERKTPATNTALPTDSVQGATMPRDTSDIFEETPDKVLDPLDPTQGKAVTSATETVDEEQAWLSRPDKTINSNSSPREVHEDAIDYLTALTIHADTQCWAYIVDRTGSVIVHRILQPGYRRTVFGFAPLDIKLGNAAGVQLWVNDEPYDITQHISLRGTAFFQLGIDSQ